MLVVVTRTRLEVDERAFTKLNGLLARTHDHALQIAAESAARQGEKSREVFPTELDRYRRRRRSRSRSMRCLLWGRREPARGVAPG
jgi:hypothetical protein